MAGKTGPTSKAGKEKSSRNATKHGLRASKWLSVTEQLDFEQLMADLEAEYQPSTATQRILVERIATCVGKLRRLQGIEDAMFEKARIEHVESEYRFHPERAANTVERIRAAATPPLHQLDTLVRYQTTLDRQLSKAIGELMVLKDREKSAVQIQTLSVQTLPEGGNGT
jgi:hypothetical protein